MKIRLSYVLLLAALAVSLVFDVLFYKAPNLGINMLLAELAFLGVSMWLATSQKVDVTRPAKVAAGFALAFAATFALWTSNWSLTMCFIGFLVANLLFVAFMLGEAAHFRHPFDILNHLIVTPVKHAIFALPFVRTLMPERFTPRTKSVVKAAIVTLPILFIFTVIFAAADAVFRSYIVDVLKSINTWLSIPNVIGHVIFIGFFLFLFCAFFAAAFWRRKAFPKKSVDSSARAVLESKIILGSVAALFALFLVISGSALFGGAAAFAHLDVTYAEYAHQGFGQLCAAAALVIGLIMTLRVLHTEAVDKKLLGLQVTLLVEAALVLVSAFMRLGMYINAYGYTPARLFGMWFFALVTVCIALTMANVAHRKHQSILVAHILVVTGAAILLFTVLAPDALSVRLNAARADAAHPLTFENSFLNLTEEAYPVTIALYSASTQPKIDDLLVPAPSIADYCTAFSVQTRTSSLQAVQDDYFARETILAFFHHGMLHTDRWQSWNLARRRADADITTAIPAWLDTAHTFAEAGSDDLYANPLCNVAQ